MQRSRLVVLGVVAFVVGVAGSRFAVQARPQEAPAKAEVPMLVGATLLEGLGNHRFEVSSKVPEVQRWFDQALMLTYGFNHDAAERSFLKATQLDPECAMCWWGASLVLGPHVNAAMDPNNNAKAWERLQKAKALAPKASEREQAFIRALESRFAEHPPEDRKPLDEAYAVAAGELAKARPDDLDAAVFHAEALMDLQPWDYYDAQLNPKGGTATVVSTLESVMQRDPDHAGALHLYVHAVEASADPQRGVVAADRLRTLIPGSGHLVHMPAHIYARVGRWQDAVVANQKAIEADDAYLAACRANATGVYPLGYVPHNHHFLWFAASMQGSEAIARAAAEHTSERTNLPDLMRQPGFEGLQNFWMTPWFERVRFARWDEIAGLPNPAPDLPYVTAIWHYAQGMAAVRQGRMDDARKHHDALAALAADPVLAAQLMWDRYPLSHGAIIAERTLGSELALAALQTAVAEEAKIPYDEPPGWHAPTRLAYGSALLAAGRAAEAETAFREELRRNPGNGWSLQGLVTAMEAQKRDASAERAQLDQAWAHADTKPVGAHL